MSLNRPVTLSQLAERVEVNRQGTDVRLDKIEDNLRWLVWLVASSLVMIIVAVIIAALRTT